MIATIGVLGFIGGLGFFDTQGATTFGGLSTNGALSTISVVTAAILLAAAIRGGKLASTVMIVIGALFLRLGVRQPRGDRAPRTTCWRSACPTSSSRSARASCCSSWAPTGASRSKLPPDNPYRRERGADDEEPEDAHRQSYPSSPAEADADAAMAEAARALAQGTADDEQRRRLAALDEARNHEDRRAIWMRFDSLGRRGRDVPRPRHGLRSPLPVGGGRSARSDLVRRPRRLIDVDA